MMGKTRCSLYIDNGSSVGVEDLSAHKTAITRSKEYVTGSNFAWLSKATQWVSMKTGSVLLPSSY